jgi:hypothetical protein
MEVVERRRQKSSSMSSNLENHHILPIVRACMHYQMKSRGGGLAHNKSEAHTVCMIDIKHIVTRWTAHLFTDTIFSLCINHPSVDLTLTLTLTL